MSFANKVVVITGAASGMGAQIAITFAKLNASLCIIDINEKGLMEIKKECERLTKGKVFEVVADLAKEEDVKKISDTFEKLERINVLVNNAGVAVQGRLQDPDIIRKFDSVMSINLRAMVVMTKLALSGLIESKGCIINTSSVGSKMIMSNMSPYTISKAGVAHFTKCAAFELANLGVRVNCISPGPVRTNICKSIGFTDEEQALYWDKLAQMLPLKKCVKVEEVAELVVYLASDKAASITGSDFVIDSGMILGTHEASFGIHSDSKKLE